MLKKGFMIQLLGCWINIVAHSKNASRDVTVRVIAQRRRTLASCHSSSGCHFMVL